jgi:4'-phosphopantetheinyl transferase
LRDHDIHLFYADVDSFSPYVGILRETLSDKEHARAMRFHFQKDKDGYVITRGLLRVMLGGYANTEPGNLLLVNGPHGKPMLDGESNPDSVRFSVSHCGRRALYAFARGRELGVDLEKIRPDFSCEKISDRFFSPREAAFIRAVPEHERAETFFAYWTLKEAFLKGTGKGLSLPLDGFELSHDPPKVLSIGGDRGAASRWSVRNVRLEPGYAAALAVEGPDAPVRFYPLHPPTEGFGTSSAVDSAR